MPLNGAFFHRHSTRSPAPFVRSHTRSVLYPPIHSQSCEKCGKVSEPSERSECIRLKDVVKGGRFTKDGGVTTLVELCSRHAPPVGVEITAPAWTNAIGSGNFGTFVVSSARNDSNFQ